MELLKKIRLRIGRSVLHSRSGSVIRLKQKFDLEKVARIGIVWDSSNEEDLKHIAALSRKMSETGKSVEVLTWIPGKTVPDRLTGLTNMKFLRRTDLNWNFLPSSADAKAFIDQRFDLLIDINPSAVFPLLCVSTLSPSPMKVGPDVNGNSHELPYDLMIQAGHPFNTAQFIEQALIYLSMISNPETRA